MKHGAAEKRTHAHGARGNCTTCLQDPCGCVSQDIPASYCGIAYEAQKRSGQTHSPLDKEGRGVKKRREHACP